MSNNNAKCMKDKVQKNDREPLSPPSTEEEDEDDDSKPRSPPPEPIQKTFSHTSLSKYHIKCTEIEFPKKKRKPPPPPSPPSPPEPIKKRSSLLDVLSATRNCMCEVVARAVRSHIHMNIGMEGKRDYINGVRDISSSTKLDKPTE